MYFSTLELADIGIEWRARGWVEVGYAKKCVSNFYLSDKGQTFREYLRAASREKGECVCLFGGGGVGASIDKLHRCKPS